ncbi:MAG: hypothetical protein C0501_15895 [Isosphaera sp.]|nr:hypothetical protein [Isosphaera sp.]
MPANTPESGDPVVATLVAALQPYTAAHPAAAVDAYRYSPVSVRIRVTDPDFRGKTRSERHREVWPLLHALDDDEDSLGELTMLLLVTPEERGASPADRDFDHGKVVPFEAALGAALREVRGAGRTTP